MSQYLIDQIQRDDKHPSGMPKPRNWGSGDDTLDCGPSQSHAMQAGQRQTVPTNGLFIFIGAEPRTQWLEGVVERDARGFVLTGPGPLDATASAQEGGQLDRDPGLLETNVPGIFAIGDVRHGSIKRVASSVGEGSVAIQFVHQYLSKV